MAKKPKLSERPIGFILPALVFGLGVAALWTGVPKELKVRRLNASGVKVQGEVKEDDHDFKSKKRFVTLGYTANGQSYTVATEQDDASIPADGHPNRSLIYLPEDPSVSTADLAGETKLANEYLVAAVLELGVGGWLTFAALRQRRRALLKVIAEKRARNL